MDGINSEKTVADINVKSDFGAFGDGAHDDTKAIQNALNSIKECGGTVCFPAGIYAVSSCIIFYSNQTLIFDGNAVLKRIPLGKKSEPKELRYLMASYTCDEPEYGDYNGVHGAKIIGATFDGNENIRDAENEASKITLLNLCHTKDVEISNCTFINCSVWHCLEINSSEGTLVKNCKFDGESYTVIRNANNELLQIDAAKIGLYGPVFWQDGTEMKFVSDLTVCRNIEICNNVFVCNGFAAIGNHSDFPHRDIYIHDNIFVGKPDERGYLAFMESVKNVREEQNSYNKCE